MLSGCASEKAAEGITSIEQLKEPGRRIGVASDTADDQLVMKYFPDAQIEYFRDSIAAYTSVSQGKLDAYAYGRLAMETALRNGLTGVRLLDEDLGDGNTGAIALSPLSDIPDLESKVNAFIAEIKTDGTLDDIDRRWLVEHDETMPDIPVPETSDLHLTVGTTGSDMPFSYYTGTELNGREIELARRFAAWLGATLEFKVYDYNGIVAGALSGDVDCIIANLYITPEREESVTFSDPTFVAKIALMVKDDASSDAPAGTPVPSADQPNDSSLIRSIRSSFEKTFIREDRWRLFIKGILTTLLITILSIILGTLLGFGVYMLCRTGNPAANLVTRFFVWLVQGMPAVVLLMILYYVVFGWVTINGIVVSVIGFTLTFGASTYEMLISGVGAIDHGQTEAAYALGYTDTQTFFRVILPQAIPHFMPAYKAAITGLIKATAIVGYIAVQDVTKIGDIIRSRTYEAFFPLLVVAAVYFIIAALLTFFVKKFEIRSDPKRRRSKDILKGVDIHDRA